MEWNGVQPDKEIHDIVANAFGEWNFATRKIKRMLYWMPKLKHTNKYLDRRHVENQKLDEVQLAKIALKMMCRDPGTTFTLVKTMDGSIDIATQEEASSWIVSAQSPLQKRLASLLPEKTTLYVDGPNLVYVMDRRVYYFALTSPPDDVDFEEFEDQKDIYDTKKFAERVFASTSLVEKNIHQQRDETILGLAVFEHPMESMAVRWMNHLTETNPNLSNTNILFRIKRDEIHIPDDEEEETAQSANI